MVEVEHYRKEWWDEARSVLGVSAVDFDFVPIGDGKVVVKAKVAAKDVVASYGVVSEKDARSIGAAQVKAIKKALQFIKGEFESLTFDDEKPSTPKSAPQKVTYAGKKGGYKASGYKKKTYKKNDAAKYPPNGPNGTYVCEVCGAEISPGVARYSKDKFGVYLCREHQQEAEQQ